MKRQRKFKNSTAEQRADLIAEQIDRVFARKQKWAESDKRINGPVCMCGGCAWLDWLNDRSVDEALAQSLL